MRNFFLGCFTLLSIALSAQTQVGDKWVDNNLELRVDYDDIKKTGVFSVCIFQIERQQCIENLSTGFLIEVQDAEGKVLWSGKAMGRKKNMKLPQLFPKAKFLVLKAFKPYVVNKNTGTRIHQDAPLEVKYNIK